MSYNSQLCQYRRIVQRKDRARKVYPKDGRNLFQRFALCIRVIEDHQECTKASGDNEAEIVSPSNIPRRSSMSQGDQANFLGGGRQDLLKCLRRSLKPDNIHQTVTNGG